MEYRLLSWNGKAYPAKTVTIFSGTKREMQATVSVIELEERLTNEECQCISPEAEELDNQVTYYLDIDEFKLPEEQIISIIEDALQ